MIARRPFLAILMGGAACLFPGVASSQSRDIDASAGRWWYGGGHADYYSLAFHRPLFGAVSWGLGGVHVADAATLDDRTATGGRLSLALWRDGSGLYAVSSTGLTMRHVDGNVDAFWSAGGGIAVRPLSFVSLGAEILYRVEDRGLGGFWNLGPADRRGLQLSAGLRIGAGGGNPSAPRGGRGAVPLRPPSRTEILSASRARGASEADAAVALQVVETALSVMGSPYRWGGTDQNGFDCSGLIKYAYEQHGIIIPRVSRDQARTGVTVGTDLGSLRPGDILGFSVERTNRVTHVGLYVGNGQFIHSASGGVKLSSLAGSDGDSSWWARRLVTARRILY